MTYETIHVDVEDGIASVVLNRPEKLNAITPLMTKELEKAITAAGDDPQVRVIVLRGEGRSFSTGADLKVKSEVPDIEGMFERHTSLKGRHYWYIWESTKPVIAAVQGHCLAGAAWMVSLCDMTIAADDALFGWPTVRFAQHPALSPMSAVMGIKHAKELLLTGDNITAERAERIGFVNKVVPAADLLTETYALAKKIADHPPLGVAMNKRAVNRIYEAMGVGALADMGSELLTLANYIQASAGGDSGFRERVREIGVTAAVRERDANL